MNPELKELRLDEITPSKTNPRKDFSSPAAQAYLEELAATIRERGVKQPALVRPDYCLHTRTTAEIEAKRHTPIFYVLIAGECRMRASALAGKETLPCLVEEATDDDAREIQQIENLQRRDLTPLEEAEGIAAMLELKTDAGAPRYTVETLAHKVGRQVDWVYKRIALLQLPAVAREAMQAGILHPKTARLVAIVPDAAMREKFAREVIKPRYGEGPLSYRAAKELKDEQYTRTLKGAPFALEDGDLLPEAGPCAKCPKMSANCPELFDDEEKAAHLKGRMCLDPVCYQKKIDALHARHAKEAAAAGKTILSAKEAEKIFPSYEQAGEMAWGCQYADITRPPNEELLKKEVKKTPSWKRLIEEAEAKLGMKVPRVLAHDQGNVLRELVDVKLAMAAVEKAGEPIFRSATERTQPQAGSDYEKQRKAELERAKVRLEVSLSTLQAVYDKLVAMWDPSPVWEALWDAAIDHAGADGLWLIGKWRNLKFGEGGSDKAKTIWKWAEKLLPAERQALVPLLLASQQMKWSGAQCTNLDPLVSLTKVDLKKIAADVAECRRIEKGAKAQKAEIANGKKKKLAKEEAPAAPAKDQGTKRPKDQGTKAKESKRADLTDVIRSEVRRLVESGFTGAEIAKKCGISLPSVQRIKKALGFVKERAEARREKGAAAR